ERFTPDTHEFFRRARAWRPRHELVRVTPSFFPAPQVRLCFRNILRTSIAGRIDFLETGVWARRFWLRYRKIDNVLARKFHALPHFVSGAIRVGDNDQLRQPVECTSISRDLDDAIGDGTGLAGAGRCSYGKIPIKLARELLSRWLINRFHNCFRGQKRGASVPIFRAANQDRW